MRDLGLAVRVDRIGNVVATRAGADDPALDPVMTGSHIDTVRTGGRYDGTLGVLAGLEVVRALDDAGVRTRRPLAVAFFTDEEGSRFAPDMLGSLVYAGGMALEDALGVVGHRRRRARRRARADRVGRRRRGARAGAARLRRAAHRAGPAARGAGRHHRRGHGVQGISWQELTLTGQSNHAGTTPMRLRRDAGYAAAEVATVVRRLARRAGRPPGRDGRAARPASRPGQRRRGPGHADGRPAQHRRGRAGRGRVAAAGTGRPSSPRPRASRRRGGALARFEPVAFDAG